MKSQKKAARKRISVTTGTYKLIEELIAITGESVYRALHRSVEERLHHIKQERLKGVKTTTHFSEIKNDTSGTD